MRTKKKETVEEEAVADYWRASELLQTERAHVLRKSLRMGDPVALRLEQYQDNSEAFLKAVLGKAYDGGKGSRLT